MLQIDSSKERVLWYRNIHPNWNNFLMLEILVFLYYKTKREFWLVIIDCWLWKFCLDFDSDLEQMKEKFAKLLLGEDMSGGGKGVSSALALSNAITNLAGIFSFPGFSLCYVIYLIENGFCLINIK